MAGLFNSEPFVCPLSRLQTIFWHSVNSASCSCGMHICTVYKILYGALGHVDDVYEKLKQAANLNVYKKDEMDPRFHYKNNRRIMPIIVSSVEGYRLCKNATICARDAGNNFMHEFHFYGAVVCKRSICCDQMDHSVFR